MTRASRIIAILCCPVLAVASWPVPQAAGASGGSSAVLISSVEFQLTCPVQRAKVAGCVEHYQGHPPGSITVTVTGSGFGTLPRELPFSGDTGFFILEDVPNQWNAANTTNGLCEFTCEGPDTITGHYQVWTNTSVIVTITNPWQWSVGNKMKVRVESPQSQIVASWTGGLQSAPPDSAWAGYISSNPPKDAVVSARVDVPATTCTQPNVAALWVGYDGARFHNVPDNYVEQDGIDIVCDQSGAAPYYEIWYELFASKELSGLDQLFGDPQMEVLHTVRGQDFAGDHLNLFVDHYNGGVTTSNPTGQTIISFSIGLFSPTNAKVWSWSGTKKEPLFFDAPFATSECIVEAPNWGEYPLPAFAPVKFTNCSAIDDAPDAAALHVSNVVEGGRMLTTTSPIQETASGEGYFTVSPLP